MVETSGSEAARLAAVWRYGILDTPPTAMLDDVADVAARALQCPIAVISLVDKERIWLKAHPGIEGVDTLARDSGLCGTAVMQDDPWVVENAAIDPRTLTNPLVAGSFGLRFYAGVPLRSPEGYNLGMLAVIDRAPRTISDDQLAILKKLAGLVVHFLEMRVDLRMATRAADRRITSAA